MLARRRLPITIITEEQFIVVLDCAALNALLAINALPRIGLHRSHDRARLEVQTLIRMHALLTCRAANQLIVVDMGLTAYAASLV